MQTHIPKEFEDFIRSQLGSGKFRSEQEIITEALRAFRSHEEKRDSFRADIQKGIDALDRGEGIAHEKVMSEMDGLIAGYLPAGTE